LLKVLTELKNLLKKIFDVGGSMNFKKVMIDNVESNMILAKDVVTKNGMIIFVKGCSLSDADIRKLKKNSIEYIYTYERIDPNRSDVEEEHDFEKECDKDIIERKEFKKFVNVYSNRVSRIKEAFSDLVKGKPIDALGLYANAYSILEAVGCKRDIVNYIYHLRLFDDYTFRHSVNVSIFCYLFAEWANMSYDEKRDITVAGILHDVGKTMVDDRILNKTSGLTDEEFSEMKKHTAYGYMLLIDQNIPDRVKLSTLMHHEKLDGTGYPFGICDSDIAEFAKIVSVCDIYDAMTSNRAYHTKKCPFEVLKEFEQNYYGSLDVKNVMIFSKNIAYSYIGSKVMLSNNEEAEIVFINHRSLSKPIVKIGEQFVDLCANSGLYIKSLI